MTSSSSVDGFDFGRSYVVYPAEEHLATIVWLHDIGRTGLDSTQAVKNLRNPKIKWICPTAPVRPITSMGGRRTTAWFDVYSPISEGMRDDLGSLNYVNTYVDLLLSYEPSFAIKGVGGFGMGAAQALFFASCFAIGRVPTQPKIVIGINGWLPDLRNLQANMEEHSRTVLRVVSLRILITHGVSTNVATYAQYRFVAKCFNSLRSCKFTVSFKPYGGALAIDEIRLWLLENGC